MSDTSEAADKSGLSAFNNTSDDNISMISKVSHSVVSTKTRDGKKKINQYIIMKLIGKGSFGKVKLVYNTDEKNKQYAMKSIVKKNRIKGIIKGRGQRNELNEIM